MANETGDDDAVVSGILPDQRDLPVFGVCAGRVLVSQHVVSSPTSLRFFSAVRPPDKDARVLVGLVHAAAGPAAGNGDGVLRRGDQGRFTPIAADGVRVEPTLGQRVSTTVNQPIAPHFLNGRFEAGAPVRYGGRGFRCVDSRDGRWKALVRVEGCRRLLATAATAAGPAVAGIISHVGRRRRHARPTSLAAARSMVDVRSGDRARIALAPFAVLIEGESGSGKGAGGPRASASGRRRDRPFRTLNCAALPDDLVEAELFGHSRGAFTGAVAERPGVFEDAHGGHVVSRRGRRALAARAGEAAAVDSGRRVATGRRKPTAPRRRAARRRDQPRSAAGSRRRAVSSRSARIAGRHSDRVPPLRDAARRHRACSPNISGAMRRRASAAARRCRSPTLAHLARYDWPGNVRELQNVLAALAVRRPRRGVVPPSALPPNLTASSAEHAWRSTRPGAPSRTQFVRAALARTGGHRRAPRRNSASHDRG